ncbi:hypothetical protein EDD18DRAFT_1326863 [Armillaria luteobubalina]|uniref:Fe2OG dioxygenase domain-containing protein n=1 Tax=Armillaria luteobubalina TaxID=153913 RepID=A0AA39QJG0_9AGAR|nr:hypothetical protein EDD18DRAFT_1326863 [Armillaria luteobubalina]
MSLPIIDILPYLEDNRSPSNEAQRREVATKIHNACIDYGFFYLDISSYVDPREPEELTALARQFFTLPQEEKDKIALKNEDHARGYARLKENVTNGKADNHEGIDWYRPVEKPDKTKPLWGENQWPTVPTFRAKYEIWVDKMKALGLIVMGVMADGLGMTSKEREDLCRQVDDSFWVMRAIGYPPLPNDHDGFSCGAHKDYGCLTFLYTDPTPAALQVFTHNVDIVESDASDLPAEQGTQAGSWINADPIPGCVVCNIGEMWEIWTNGLYKSTVHRVVHRSKNYRIPFFFEPNFNARIEPLAAALRIKADKPNPDEKEYKSVVYGDFLLNKVGNNFADGKGKY